MADPPLSGISLNSRSYTILHFQLKNESCEVYEKPLAGEISGIQNQLAMQTKHNKFPQQLAININWFYMAMV
jgi:hypothetical protein